MNGPSSNPVHARAQTVLVVDDHEGFRRRARRLLERHRYRVVEAADGAAALRLAIAEQPDVVLLDVRLPDMDGFAVAEALRRAGTNVAILLTSTQPEGDLADRLRTSTADGFIDKADLTAAAIAATLAAHT